MRCILECFLTPLFSFKAVLLDERHFLLLSVHSTSAEVNLNPATLETNREHLRQND